MAKKNFYAVRVGRKTGIFTTWDGEDGAKAQVIGFAGAKYKGFATKEEAEIFLAGEESGGAQDVADAGRGSFGGASDATGAGRGGSSGASGATGAGRDGFGVSSGVADGAALSDSVGIISREQALSYLQKVVVVSDVSTQAEQLKEVFDRIAAEPLSEEALTETERWQKLSDRYGMMLNDGMIFGSHPDMDAVAFVDGGGDKSGEKQASSAIPFGVIFFMKDSSSAKLYRYAFTKTADPALAWIFHASNVSAEVIADLFVMDLCEKNGLRSATIYQDNNLPAKYFSGEFKKIHNDEDYVLQTYITESIRHLKDGMDIRYVYVPSEHSAKAKAKKQQSYEAQTLPKVSFEVAEFYNAVSDILADYRWAE